MNKLFLILICFSNIGKGDIKAGSHKPKLLEIKEVFKSKNQITSLDTINLTIFTELPKDIMGCACYFYLTKSDQKEKRFIFANNFYQTAYISINGKLTKFTLYKHKEDSNLFEYTNNSYKLNVSFSKRQSEGSEGFSIIGIIILKQKNKVVAKKNIIGYCGC